MTPETGAPVVSMARVYRLIPWVAAAGVLAAFAWRGWQAGAAFALGAVASYFNLKWLHEAVDGLAPDGRKPRTLVYVFLVLRYGILGAGGYVIVKVFGLSGIAAVGGLFVPLVAIITEAIYELAHGT